MCGIVGAVAQRDVVPILIEGLRRLEYRGYDSAGVAVLKGSGTIKRLRAVGKVRMLQDALDADPTHGLLGIAHTRWATHGVPSERNAHPHISRDGIALVHNGIIENHEQLRAELQAAGYEFTSETDTEVIAHRVHYHLQKTRDLFKAVRATVAELEGAYALVVISQQEPERLVLARQGCPVLHPARKVKGVSPPEFRQTHQVQVFIHPQHLSPVLWVDLLRQGDIAAHRLPGQQGWGLRQPTDFFLAHDFSGMGSVEQHLSLVWFEQPCQDAQQRGFAAAARPDQGDDFAAGKAQVDRLQSRQLAFIGQHVGVADVVGADVHPAACRPFQPRIQSGWMRKIVPVRWRRPGWSGSPR